jgi:predicted P-loop ATPase
MSNLTDEDKARYVVIGRKPSDTVVPFKKKQQSEPLVEWPELTKDGLPKRSYRNARAAIKAIGASLSFDEFHDLMLIVCGAIGEWAGELTDAACSALRQAIVNAYEFDPGKEHIHDAATQLCIENKFNPIIQYLDGLQWDGKPRIGTWLSTYLGADDTPLHQAQGQLILIAAVRRARKPGCKFDHILTLEGLEGTMKSSAIAVLAGDGNFSDQAILGASEKEQQEHLRGVWFYEIAELAGIKRADAAKVKSFASRTEDRARPAYGRRLVTAKRRCIFIGTTNDKLYLQSQTGNRRFWPVETNVIDIEKLKADRDQLFAEAAVLEAKGFPLSLPQALWAAAAEAQEERRNVEPWEEMLAPKLVAIAGAIHSTAEGEQERLTTRQILTTYLGFTDDKIQPWMYQKLAPIMNRLGWKGPKQMKVNGLNLQTYRRKIPPA